MAVVIKKLKDGFWVLSAVEEKRRGFVGDSYTDSGMMFNTYLLESEDEAVVFGAPPPRLAEEWTRLVTERISGKERLDFVSFCQPGDRAALEALARLEKELTVIGSAGTLYALDTEVKSICVRGRRRLSLAGEAFSLEDTDSGSLLAFCDRRRLCVSGTDFGAYCAEPGLTVSAMADKDRWLSGAKNYLRDHPGRKKRAALLERDIELLCPAYGPVVDAEMERLARLYADKEETGAADVAVLYDPGAYTAALAAQIAGGIRESDGVRVELLDLSGVNRDEALEKAARAGALLFGTAQVGGRAAKAVLDILSSLDAKSCGGKLAAAFVSASSQESGNGSIKGLMKALGFDLSVSDFLCVGKPDEAMRKAAFEYGFAFGCRFQRIPNPRQPKMVKCLICGEVFDASLGTCPVCGVGLDQCVPVDEETVSFRRDTDRRYLILGGGVAAVSAADAIRRRDKTGRITLLSAERERPINRPMLTKDLLSADRAPETLFIHGKEWYNEREIDLRLGCRAISLNTQEKTVTTSGGETLCYDRLIYALGAECAVPPIEGRDKEGVLTVRHLPDKEELASRMLTAKSAVVIGGGILGLEAASEMMRSGIRVTVLEAAPYILNRQVDAESAAVLKQTMEHMGVACHEGVSIAAIEGGGQVTGVRLTDGRRFPADIVVVSCGNRANMDLAREAGLTGERFVQVNQRMETGVPDVYACGDCAEYEGVNFMLWQEAVEQGRIAGANAAGDELTYAGKPLGLSLEGFGTSLFAIGDAGKAEGVPYKTVELRDRVRNKQEKYWFFGNSLQGAVVIGAPEQVGRVTQAVTEHAGYDELF